MDDTFLTISSITILFEVLTKRYITSEKVFTFNRRTIDDHEAIIIMIPHFKSIVDVHTNSGMNKRSKEKIHSYIYLDIVVMLSRKLIELILPQPFAMCAKCDDDDDSTYTYPSTSQNSHWDFCSLRINKIKSVIESSINNQQ